MESVNLEYCKKKKKKNSALCSGSDTPNFSVELIASLLTLFASLMHIHKHFQFYNCLFSHFL